MFKNKQIIFMLMTAFSLGGCGLITPEMIYPSALSVPAGQGISEADFESNIISHVGCEISLGLLKAEQIPGASKTLGWLRTSGALTQFKLIAEDQGSVAPNSAFITPFVGGQSFAFGIGAAASANATRTETIQLTYPDKQLYAIAQENEVANLGGCSSFQKGVMIDSNLKIADFIYDKALMASRVVPPNLLVKSSPFVQMQFEINFVASYSGNATPTWKFTRVNVNTSGNLLAATRTNTNDVLITIGPLNSSTAALHSAAQIGSAAGQAVQSQSH